MRIRRGILLIAVIALGADVGCTDTSRAAATQPGVESGRALVAANGCGTCHEISGVSNAKGTIGPPLSGMAQRTYIAGMLPNTPANLAAWIRNPQAFKPGVAMPDLGLTQGQATDIAAYLYSRY